MPTPHAPALTLAEPVEQQLRLIQRAPSTPQALAFRCRLILRLAEPDQPTNGTVAEEFDCKRDTVSKWRQRFLVHGLLGLQDAPRSGRPRSFSPRRTPVGRHPGQ